MIVGSVFSFYSGNAEVFIFTISLVAGLAGLKTWSEGLTRRRRIDKWSGSYNEYDNFDEQNPKSFDEIG